MRDQIIPKVGRFRGARSWQEIAGRCSHTSQLENPLFSKSLTALRWLAEINQLSHFDVAITFHKKGRTIVDVEIHWTLKADVADTK